MPGMDGWEVAEKLRANPDTYNMRIVAVSALMTPECEQRSRAAGIEAHFGKPVALAQWPKLLSG
jgi:CheY-like chemotaxis protein